MSAALPLISSIMEAQGQGLEMCVEAIRYDVMKRKQLKMFKMLPDNKTALKIIILAICFQAISQV